MSVDTVFHFILLLSLLKSNGVIANGDNTNHMHPELPQSDHPSNSLRQSQERLIEFWRTNANEYIAQKRRINEMLNENVAKNIVMFVGDGLSLQTVAAARMYMGGEEINLSFEDFPYFGLSKTYGVDYQVSDSANTINALLHGVKSNYGTVGVNGHVPLEHCTAALDQATHTHSFAKWAQDMCKATGFVTTARVTHATPSGIYAHTSSRYWENDAQVIRDNCNPSETIDIGQQLIEHEVGKKLKVILGGGRQEFRSRFLLDEEGAAGTRVEGRDLIVRWQIERGQRGNASYIWNKQQLQSIDIDNTDYLLGLFEASHCMYNIDIERFNRADMEPTLTEMTEAALKILQKDENGYFLFVEAARIDHAHHQTWARRALDETKELSSVVEMVRRMTNESDTLIIVTSDHSHVMSYNGHPLRGSDILGLSGNVGSDGLPYPTLSYANGIGFLNTYDEHGARRDMSQTNFSDPDLWYMSMMPLPEETHGGDDVGVYASGPWAHLFVGNYEQNAIPVAMAYAAKIGPYAENIDNMVCGCSGRYALPINILSVIALLLVVW